MLTDIDMMPTPEQALPAQAQLLLTRWRGLCGAGTSLPDLSDFAPAMVPPVLLPWSMTFRRDLGRELTYGVVGEELAFLFHGNPRGKVVLNYAAPDVRAARYTIIHRALDEGRPVWYAARHLFESGSADIGRLGLPTRIANGEALLLIYFLLSPLPSAPLHGHRLSEEHSDTVWLGRRQP